MLVRKLVNNAGYTAGYIMLVIQLVNNVGYKLG